MDEKEKAYDSDMNTVKQTGYIWLRAQEFKAWMLVFVRLEKSRLSSACCVYLFSIGKTGSRDSPNG